MLTGADGDPTAPAELPGAWRRRASLLRRYGGTALAETLEQCAADLELVLQDEQRVELNLREAAAFSGYSCDHLRRLARQSRLPVRRTGRQLWFRRGDLPRRSREFDGPSSGGYDPTADARHVIARRSRGGLHETQTTTVGEG
jgi:hypothetical protein